MYGSHRWSSDQFYRAGPRKESEAVLESGFSGRIVEIKPSGELKGTLKYSSLLSNPFLSPLKNKQTHTQNTKNLKTQPNQPKKPTEMPVGETRNSNI